MEEETLSILNTPILQSTIIIPQSHKIFIDYTTINNYDYAVNLFKSLCSNCHSKNKASLFFKCIKIFIKVLYNSKNINYFSGNFDLFLLTCFYLGMKTNEIKRKVPKLKKLIEILPKFKNYDTKDIKLTEVILIKLLDYDINMTTAYDYIYYLSSKNKPLLELAVCELEKIMREQPRNFFFQTPMELAKYSIDHVKQNSYLINYMHSRVNNTTYNEKTKLYKTIAVQKNNMSVEKLDNSSRQYNNLRKRGEIDGCSYKLLKKFSEGINSSVDHSSKYLNLNSECYVKKKINNYKKLEKENKDKGKKCKLSKINCSGDSINKMKSYVHGVNYYYSSIKKRNRDINQLKRAK